MIGPTPLSLPSAARIALAGALAALADAAWGLGYFVAILDVTTVERFFQSIAAGLLGRDAYAGGTATAALGVALHFAIGTLWAALYALALARSAALRRRVAPVAGALVAGLAFGALIWLGMDLVVLPLSRARAVPVASARFWLQLAAHALVVGPPIALALRPRSRAGG